jgi:chaperone modulatory protein CbpM
MRIETTEVIWFEQHELSLPELADLSGLPQQVLAELLDCGAIEPLGQPAGSETRFGAAALHAARTAHRLQADFELDVQGLALALRLLERVSELETQLQSLRARSPRHSSD